MFVFGLLREVLCLETSYGLFSMFSLPLYRKNYLGLFYILKYNYKKDSTNTLAHLVLKSKY